MMKGQIVTGNDMAGEAEAVVLIEQHGDIAHLTLNRAAKRNALNDAAIAALDTFFSRPPADVRAIVISGAGGHFSSGLDLSEQVHRQPLEVMAHSRNWHRVMAMVAGSSIPVIAAMSGAVMGGGLEFGAACHVRVAEDSVRFQMPEGLRGIFVGGGGSVRISRLIGPDRLTEMMLTGRTYSGAEGERLGLAHYVVPEGQSLAKAMELAERIALNSPTINAFIIQAIAQIAAMPPEAGLYAESLAAALSQTGPHAEEGLRAFLEKRPPVFK
jgi:enoyl-CoA hydratase/carnithine racemase